MGGVFGAHRDDAVGPVDDDVARAELGLGAYKHGAGIGVLVANLDDARAELLTNDEFEDLATSFNTMLRNMVEAQRKLAEANTSINAKADELAQANMRLYQLNYLKSDFLANMSHELRTPLNSIIGFSELLEGIQALTDKQKRYALRIRESGRFLLEMINDILDLAKLEAGKMRLEGKDYIVQDGDVMHFRFNN